MGKIRTQNTAQKEILARLGVFASFLLLTVFSVWIYSPVIGTHASEDVDAEVNVDVQPVISLVLDVDELNFSLRPSSNSNHVTSQKKTVTASVKTNSSSGYQLYFSSADESTDMTSTATSDVIESLTNGNSDLLPANKASWGYSKTGSDGTWNPIPKLSEQRIIKYTFSSSPTYSDTTIHIGIAILPSIAAASYSKNVSFSTIANTALPTMDLDGITYMQEMTPSICANAQIGASAILTDSRDGEEYVIMKTADDVCWMMQDLRLVGPYTLTYADSDVGVSFELPAPSSTWTNTYDAPVIKNIENPVRKEGVGYNYYAASAGSISGEDNIIYAYTSVCPKGWTLPTKTQLDAFLTENDITDDENGANKLYNSPFNFELVSSSYSYINYSYSTANKMADYWTSTNWSTYDGLRGNRWTLHITRGDSFSAKAYLHGRNQAGTIRCVAKDGSTLN